MNKLICNDVCKSFRIGNDNLNVLNNINLTIEENDTVAMVALLFSIYFFLLKYFFLKFEFYFFYY